MPRVEVVDNAVLVPTTQFEPTRQRPAANYNGGVCDESGAPVILAQHRGGKMLNITDPFTGLKPSRGLAGTWLFGGWYRKHFGHFVNECLGRLWATAEMHKGYDGIVYLEYGPVKRIKKGEAVIEGSSLALLGAFLDVLSIDTRTILVRAPHTVERLIVPEQLHLGGGSADSLKLRDFLGRAALDATPPPGLATERIYVSRAGLPARNSKFILESVIEENFKRAGYGIIRPELYSLAHQIAIYRAAKILVFAEGSAVHLAAPILRPEQRAAVLWRGTRRTPQIINQLAEKAALPPIEIQALAGFAYAAKEKGVVGVNLRLMQALPDFRQCGDQLAAAGLIESSAWRVPSESEIEAGVEAALAERRAVNPRMQHQFLASSRIPAEMHRKRKRVASGSLADQQPAQEGEDCG